MLDPVDRPMPWIMLRRWQRAARLATGAGVVLTVLSVATNRQQFLQSFLLAFLFWWLVTIGCLTLRMLHDVVGGSWGRVVRPWTENGAVMAPFMAALFLPIAVHMDELYPWMQPDVISANKARYLNAPFFYVRAFVYFVVWSALALLLRSSASYDELDPHDEAASAQRNRRRRISGAGLVITVVTVTFASLDWAMSLDPHWFVSIYGALMLIGGTLAALALATWMTSSIGGQLIAVTGRPALDVSVVRPEAAPVERSKCTALRRLEHSADGCSALGDLRQLLLSFVMLSAYFAISQFLIIWSGNLPEASVWYVDRLQGGWQWVGLSIVGLHVFIPFIGFVCGNRNANPCHLTTVCTLVLLMQFVCLVWAICPAFRPGQFSIHWADVVIPCTMGSVWISLVLWRVCNENDWVQREVEM